jgi:hypothetical protein
MARRLDRRHPPARDEPDPSPNAFAKGKTKAQILAAVTATGFIQ